MSLSPSPGTDLPATQSETKDLKDMLETKDLKDMLVYSI
jgi:hypothetical protein